MVTSGRYFERELLAPVDLCVGEGKLNRESIGWARQSLVNCNLAGHRLRKKRWNYWCSMNADCLFSATISHLDYAALIFVYFLDYKTKLFIEKTVTVPLGIGCKMPDNVHESVVFKNAAMEVRLLEEQGDTHIIVNCTNFGGYLLEAELLATRPTGHETLNVVIPWDNNTFQFTSKQEALPTSGTLRVGGHSYRFNPDIDFSCLDFGRGVWPRKSSWNWATASGLCGNRRIGLNLGGKWTDGTGMNENAIVVDGRLSKISEDVVFEYDLQNFMAPWTIRTVESDSVALEFVPFYERLAKMNLLLVKNETHQMVGHFTGHVKTAEGETLELTALPGCAEDHFALW